MDRSERRVRGVVVALACAGLAGVGAVTTFASATGPDLATAPPSSLEDSTTSGVPAFTDGEDARLAAEELISMYIESEFSVEVTDAACSVPPDGVVGDQFVCYGLKSGDLVIALRATVGEQRLIELQLLVDQQATTTTTTTAPSAAAVTTAA